jgi:hypothetical protein
MPKSSLAIRSSKPQSQRPMEKPIVFLSHSARNRIELAELKTVLDKRAAGSLEFFLSSDGQSIRFGRNWVVSISDALSQAKLMFAFLSAESANSNWIHFEAGCAYAKDIRVVPVCLPGMDLDRVKPPMGLLQGFNLHSFEAMGNLARICNEEFDLKMVETFTAEEFGALFVNSTSTGQNFFGQFSDLLLNVSIRANIEIAEGDHFDPLPKLKEIAATAGLEPLLYTPAHTKDKMEQILDLPGCSVSVALTKSDRPQSLATATDKQHLTISATISPELFHLSAPLLDKWYAEAGFHHGYTASIRTKSAVDSETVRHRLTAKLYKAGIHELEPDKFEFEKLCFQVQTHSYNQGRAKISFVTFACTGNLTDARLPRIIDRLFESEVLYQTEPENWIRV